MQNKLFEINLKALERAFPNLYSIVKSYNYTEVGELIPGKTGVLTLRYASTSGSLFAYDINDPMKDAAVHLETVPPHSTGVAVFIGMGLGYGPLIVLKERPKLVRIVIVEPSLDMFITALKATDLTSLISSEKVSIKAGDIDFKAMAMDEELNYEVAMSDTYILRHVPSFGWKKDLYEQTDRDVYALLNKINIMGGTTKYFGEILFRNRLSNLTMLPHLHSTDILKNLFKGQPALLVAAGPSLDTDIENIRRAKGRCVLIAVDAALNTLLSSNIVPDFVTAVDMQAINFEKFSNHMWKTWPFALVAPPKVCPMILKRFQARHRFLTFDHDLPQIWLTRLLGVRHFMPTMLSVAHLSLGIALHMGADPIIFTGQDLAYSSPDGSDHAIGTVFHSKGLPKDREIIYVDAVDGGQVPSDRVFLGMKTQFEEIISANKRVFINSTARGANIKGARPMPLAMAIDSYMTKSVYVESLLEEVTKRGKTWKPAKFIDYARRTTAEIKMTVDKIDMGSRIAARLLNNIAQFVHKDNAPESIASLPPDLSSSVKRFDAITNEVDACKSLWDQVAELTYGALKDNDVRIRKNRILMEKEGYTAWLISEIERIEWVESIRREALLKYSDILTSLVHRLEEEKRLKNVFNKRPSDDIFAALARLYEDSEDFILLKRLTDQYLHLHPESALANAFMGLAMAGLLDMDKANEYWKRAILLDSSLIDEISRMRNRAAAPWILLIQKEDRASDGSSFKWGEAFPNLLAKWLNRIKGALNGEQAAIRQVIEQAWPDYAGRIERAIETNDSQKATALLEAWSPFKKDGLAGFYYLGARLAYLKNDTENAVRGLERDISYCEGAAKRLSFAARVFLETGKFDEGIRFLKNAVLLDRSTATLWEELGDLLMSLNNYEGAISAFEQYLMVFKDSAEGFKKLGDCYGALGRLEAAKTAYQVAVEKMKKRGGI
ncbi:MAG: 6-hydroxymethylpterin diphosphokinase MptE-like protein [Dissulfurimicrobium sp.]|uniref:6-hydroxymethylpterin diphosphokinase MptE-like protein n=1 Tax=Dissulfurimicrobium sp. TaxID=2022436 RepID=UPI00404AD5AA